MIQIILMLLGLAFSDNNANTPTTDQNNYQPATMNLSPESGSDTSGETGQILPPKK
ncbi:hypothetical protein HNP24_003683 [Chryseobacterium sediminis]|uniref:Uncharacterized protein n=1 Tax=Chryseobacterium sediminis TaxID=1679494 RepID=A0ABR6Q407_9FLAO|nr:hypothetical protein [Chryseobacterium sediminis]MBB6332691.1 hypothetical protein [Chryseobacterium sediminis]